MSAQPQAEAWFETPQGQKFDLPTGDRYPIIIGRVGRRNTGNDPYVKIPQEPETQYVSRKHAFLYRTPEGKWEIEDQGSTSGLVVEGNRAKVNQRYELQSGTCLELGNYQLIFRTAAGAAESKEADRRKALEETGESGTRVIRDFVPSIPQKVGGVAIAERPTTGDRPEPCFLDAYLDGKVVHYEVPQAPGVTKWTVGRALPDDEAEGDEDTSGTTGHLTLPNISAYKSISRKHFLLNRFSDGRWKIKNLSRHWTKVGPERLTGENVADLQTGDKINVGNVVFVFRVGAVKPRYLEDEFVTSSISPPAELQSAHGIDESDLESTRDMERQDAAGHEHTAAQLLDSGEQPWGYLVENKLLNPRRFKLRGRRVRIGRHPLNCEIRMEDPGIDDIHAIFMWHGDRLKVHSKSTHSPVKVNHSPFRVSPGLDSGAIITLGNDEFNLEIAGRPPEAVSSIVGRRVRVAVLLLFVSVAVVIAGMITGGRLVTPLVKPYQEPEAVDQHAAMKELVREQGLAGLSLLESQIEKTPDREAVLEALREAEAAHHRIYKTPEQFFDKEMAGVDRLLDRGRQAFRLAELEPSLATGGWFGAMQTDFSRRRNREFSAKWADFITALRENVGNIDYAKSLLDKVDAPPEESHAISEAREVLASWDAIGRESRELGLPKLLSEYEATLGAIGAANTAGKTEEYLANGIRRMAGLDEAIRKVRLYQGEAAKIVTASPGWREAEAKVQTMAAALQALSAGRLGEEENFRRHLRDAGSGTEKTLLEQLSTALAALGVWRAKYASSSESGKIKLIDELPLIQSKLGVTIDRQAPILAELNRTASEFGSSRRTRGSSMRSQALALPEGPDQIVLLMNAYVFDPKESALDDLNERTIKLAVSINDSGNVAAHEGSMRQIVDKFNELSRSGLIPADSFYGVRQLDRLLESLKN